MHEKILVIDDEPDIRQLLASVLDGEGYRVVTAADGVDGLMRFQQDAPDLVILDVRMPLKNGLEVLNAIKADGSEVDVIMLTGYSDEVTAINCLRAGAYDYLLKPLEDLEVMFASVKRALHKRQIEIKNRELMRQLEELAITDPLTELFNIRHLHTCLDEEIRRSERFQHNFCGMMLDIDHFKQVNDTYGHLFGDFALKTVAGIMRRNFRVVDYLFRYGGDELFVLMPETGKEEAEIAANRLLEAVRNEPLTFAEQQMRITISIGCALYPDHATNKTGLLKAADNALYQAKKNGRNQVVFSDSITLCQGSRE